MFHIFDFVVIYLVFVEISNNTLEKLENILKQKIQEKFLLDISMMRTKRWKQFKLKDRRNPIVLTKTFAHERLENQGF